jgi:anaerobic ribonucleoside-triphosphate reductase
LDAVAGAAFSFTGWRYEMKQIKLKDEERTPCEIYSRVMGYHRPIHTYNPGKQQEYADRKMFQENKAALQ